MRFSRTSLNRRRKFLIMQFFSVVCGLPTRQVSLQHDVIFFLQVGHAVLVLIFQYSQAVLLQSCSWRKALYRRRYVLARFLTSCLWPETWIFSVCNGCFYVRRLLICQGGIVVRTTTRSPKGLETISTCCRYRGGDCSIFLWVHP